MVTPMGILIDREITIIMWKSVDKCFAAHGSLDDFSQVCVFACMLYLLILGDITIYGLTECLLILLECMAKHFILYRDFTFPCTGRELYTRKFSSLNLFTRPDHPGVSLIDQTYTCASSPWSEGNKVVVISNSNCYSRRTKISDLPQQQ